MKLMLFGPQGAGKGTIGAMLSKHFKIPILSTGQVLREAIAEGTELGKTAEEYINEGNLVPPDVAAGIVNEAVKKEEFKNGYILDGFPRNLKQTELFEEMDKIDHMIEFDAPEKLLLKRLTNRRTCEKCGAIYNIHPDCDPNPKVEGICDKCSGKLIQREDDTEEAIKKRLKIYYEETAPILKKYKYKVKKIDASDHPKAIFKRTLKAIGE